MSDIRALAHCKLAINERTGEPFALAASEDEAESLQRAGWLVVEYAPVAPAENGSDA